MTLRQKWERTILRTSKGSCGYSYAILVKVLVRGLSTERDPGFIERLTKIFCQHQKNARPKEPLEVRIKVDQLHIATYGE